MMLRDRVAVMQAALNGKMIERCRTKQKDEWHMMPEIDHFNFNDFEYRIARRAPGYYWVKPMDEAAQLGAPVIAHLDKEEHWRYPGNATCFEDDDVIVIAPVTPMGE